jgi:hypothetical protein
VSPEAHGHGHATVRFGDGPVVALEGEPDDVAWMRGFLGPWFEGPADTVGHRLLVERGGDLAPRPDGWGPVPAFTLDRGVASLPGMVTGQGVTLDDEAVGASYVTDRGRTLVLAAHGDLRARLGLLRVARELSWAAVEGADRVALHAAAFELEGGAFVVAGPRRAGKTTFLLAALHHLGAGLVANDCVSIRPGATGPVARGVPTVVRVRPGTCDLLPDVASRLAGSSSFVCLLGDPRPPRPASPDLHLGPGELARRIDRAAVAEAPVTAVLLLDGPDEEGMRRVEPDPLRGARYGQDAATRPATVFSGPRAEPPAPCEALAGVPVVRVRSTPATLTDPGRLRDLLAAAAAGGR